MKKLLYVLFAAGMVSVACSKTESPSIVLDKESIDVEYEGGQTTIGVKCNRDWIATADVDWITMSHAEETAFDAPSYILVTVLSNEDVDRTGTITIAAKSGEIKAYVRVNQGENVLVIRTADAFVNYLNLVAENNAVNGYKLGADINLSGKSLPKIETFNYAFDGQDHKISGWTSAASMFGKIGAGGSVSNLTVDSSCQLTFPAEAENFGFIATENAGKIENVTNHASADMTDFSAGNKGLICGLSTGTIQNCSNTGNINAVSPDVYTSALNIAGVVGANDGSMGSCSNTGDIVVMVGGSSYTVMVAGVVGYSTSGMSGCNNSGAVSLACESSNGKADGGVKGCAVAGVVGFVYGDSSIVDDCENTGTVSFRAGYTLGVQAVNSATKFSSNVAGVVGAAYKCAVSNCNNSGKLVSTFTNIDNASSVYQTTARQSFGGIISSTWGKVSNCNNTGDIDVDWVTSAHNAGLAKQFVGQGGGVSGGDYNSDTMSSSIESCTNSGNIDVNFDASQSNSTFGGITGWGGREAANGTNVLKGCTNTGTLTVSGYGKERVGGISGCLPKIEDCINKGKVYLKSAAATSAVGGITGFANFHNISGCENYGEVVSDVKLAGAESSAGGGIGAIVGAVGNTEMTFSGCTVKCSVTTPDGSAGSMVVGVIGHNKPGGKKLTIGTADAPIRIAGTYNGVALTEDNYTTYMRRPNFNLVNTSISFNVKFLN